MNDEPFTPGAAHLRAFPCRVCGEPVTWQGYAPMGGTFDHGEPAPTPGGSDAPHG